MADRIEAGSYACAAAITGSALDLIGAKLDEMEATVAALRQAGVHVEEIADGIAERPNGKLQALTLSTAPVPGFATDMQVQFIAMLEERPRGGSAGVERGVGDYFLLSPPPQGGGEGALNPALEAFPFGLAE